MENGNTGLTLDIAEMYYKTKQNKRIPAPSTNTNINTNTENQTKLAAVPATETVLDQEDTLKDPRDPFYKE